MPHKFFGPEKPIDESHYIWKVVIGLATFVVIGLVIGFLATARLPEKITEASLVLGVAEDIVADNSAEGVGAGDVTIAPPDPKPPQLPEKLAELPDPDDFSAESIIVKDVDSGAVLYRKNEYTERPVASLTKLMSALIILERDPVWDIQTQVVDDDIVDTHMYAGDTYTLDALWQAALIGSSNKAILTLSDAVGWPRVAFIERMNQKARELGMAQTKFVEPTGIESVNISTASDVILLLEESLKHSKIAKTLLTSDYTLFSPEREQEHHLWNTNWLLLGWITNNFHNFVGGKTGYIPESGYNFSMQVGNEEGKHISVVVLGADSHESRFTEARDIADWVFENYYWPE